MSGKGRTRLQGLLRWPWGGCWAKAGRLKNWLAEAALICMSLQMKDSVAKSSRSLAMGEEKEGRNQHLQEAVLFHHFI